MKNILLQIYRIAMLGLIALWAQNAVANPVCAVNNPAGNNYSAFGDADVEMVIADRTINTVRDFTAFSHGRECNKTTTNNQ